MQNPNLVVLPANPNMTNRSFLPPLLIPVCFPYIPPCIQADDATKEGSAVIGLQMGTNQCASQKGMKMGASRHIVDFRTDDMDKSSAAVINLQYGTNQMANQQGMSMGTRRNILHNKQNQKWPLLVPLDILLAQFFGVILHA